MVKKKENASVAEKLFAVASYKIKKSGKKAAAAMGRKAGNDASTEKQKAGINAVTAKRKAAAAGRKLMKATAIVLSLCLIVATYSFFRVRTLISKNYYDKDRAVKMINANAQPRSRGLCAMYVRSAIEQAGAPTFGFPGNAYEYTEFLPKLGFRKIATHKSRDYKPSAGDIMVFAAKPGHKNGHIAMYNGKMWVSDFKQPKGMWVAKAYELDPEWTVFSRETGWDRRDICWSDIKSYYVDEDFRNYTRRRWKRMMKD